MVSWTCEGWEVVSVTRLFKNKKRPCKPKFTGHRGVMEVVWGLHNH